MVDYVSLASVAERLIEQNGRDVTLRKENRTPADSNAPWQGTSGAVTDIGPLKGVFVEYDNEGIDGDRVRRGDKRLFVAANDTSLQIVEGFDKVVDGTETWAIVAVRIVQPGDTLIIYDIQVRR